MTTKMCILSDTHDNFEVAKRAAEQIRALSPDLVIHCGDITSPLTLELFKGLPLKAVLGNCDTEAEELQAACLRLGFGSLQKEIEISLGGKDFYVNHGVREQLIDEQAGAQVYDYVLHGHTHRMRDEVLGRTRIINPGALSSAPKYTFAVLEPETDALSFIEIVTVGLKT